MRERLRSRHFTVTVARNKAASHAQYVVEDSRAVLRLLLLCRLC